MGNCFAKCYSRSEIYQYKIQVDEIAEHFYKKFLNSEDIRTMNLDFRVAMSSFRARSLTKKNVFLEISFTNDAAQKFTSPPIPHNENPAWNFSHEFRISSLYEALPKNYLEIVFLSKYLNFSSRKLIIQILKELLSFYPY